MSADPMRVRLEEQFRAVGVVDAIVARCGGLGFFHARRLASLVGHPGRPDLLLVDWGEPANRIVDQERTLFRKRADGGDRIVRGQQIGKRMEGRPQIEWNQSVAVDPPNADRVGVVNEFCYVHGSKDIEIWLTRGAS